LSCEFNTLAEFLLEDATHESEKEPGSFVLYFVAQDNK
jgi:hypothetical protein